MEAKLPEATAIHLAADDNVGIVTSDLRPTTEIHVGGRLVTVQDPIPFGHKIALLPIAAGAVVMKFGVPIGRAKADISPGEHVHMHNLESSYINNAVDHYES
ncbi:MAG: UxaA family hydrolase [Geminicoccaceae bacterium]